MQSEKLEPPALCLVSVASGMQTLKEQIDFEAYIEENKADFMPDDWRPPKSWFTKDERRPPPEPKEAQPSTSTDRHDVDESNSASRRPSPPPAPLSLSALIQAGQKRTFDELDDTANEDVAPEQEEGVDEDEEMIEFKPTAAKDVAVIKIYRKVVPARSDKYPIQPNADGSWEMEWVGALGRKGSGKMSCYVLNIKWKGYGYEDMTWEGFDNVSDDVFEETWREHGSPEE
ncbi:hypothetical protein LTS15_000007 [Exophiala xenobiotica]|nr:hypothetical protein LTS15_000007 [Exophiala xenobiotica]